MSQVVLVLGGCKSGKTSFALSLATAYEGYKKIYLATSIVCDREMQKRVDRHKKERGDSWTTKEYPYELSKGLYSLMDEGNLIVVDCLTMWINNLLYKGLNEKDIINEIKKVSDVLSNPMGIIILVSNEVGLGIVPSDFVSRQFRDLVGILHQRVAKCADKVYFTVAGIPSLIKGSK